MQHFGNWIVPTPPPGDSSYQVADTAFVTQAISAAISTAFNLAGTTIAVQFVVPGGGTTLTTGNKGWLQIPITATIGTWTVLADQVGTVTIDILRANAAFPQTSIVGGGVKPNLASTQFSTVAVSGWSSTVLVPNDWVAFNITGTIASCQQITVSLTCTRAF